jgi:surface antigen
MIAKPFVLALAALMAVTPVAGAFAEEAAQVQDKKGIFALFAPKDAAEKAERKAEREARRAEKKRARTAEGGHSASAGEAARVEVKEAVAEASANRPKGRLWCVPFARAVTGVDIRGNAKTWWAQAKDRYARGQEPQVGAVMAFASSRAMPMGHVAVVSKVVSDREILIDHANWERNRITEDALVVDVSEKGDWSRVKVANAGGTLGRVNPVNGFIYN